MIKGFWELTLKRSEERDKKNTTMTARLSEADIPDQRIQSKPHTVVLHSVKTHGLQQAAGRMACNPRADSLTSALT